MNSRSEDGAESVERSKFEWRPEDITILDDDEDQGEVEDEDAD